MTGDVRVVEDGLDSGAPPPPPQRPPWLWLAAGLLVGLGLAIVFVLAGSDEPEPAAEQVSFPQVEEPAESTAEATNSTIAEPEGVGERVGDFPDTLMAVTQLSGGNLAHLTWPVTGPPIEAALPGFSTSSVEFDSSGRLLAQGAGLPESDRVLLSFGTPVRLRPMAADVTGFAWHDTSAGELAYTQVIDGGWRLSVVDLSREPAVLAQEDVAQGGVAAWGDWGFAIEGDNAVALLTPSAEVIRTVEGRVLASDGTGRLAVSDGVLSLVEIDGEDEVLDVDLSLIGEVEAARFSPDGTKLAVVGGGGHLIVSLESEEESFFAPVTSGFPQLAWSSDSRFLISPWIRGVLFIDTERGSQPLAELTRHTVIAVATVPLSEG